MVKIRDDLPILANGMIDLDRCLERWFDRLSQQYTLLDRSVVDSAARLSLSLGLGSEPFYTAQKLAMLGADADTLAAALLYAPTINPLIVNLLINPSILILLENLKKIDALNHLPHKKSKQMITSVVEDPRALLIKLANQLVVMRACAAPRCDPLRRMNLSQETREIYAPLANRLGIGQLKWELEDSAFRYLEPESYQRIAKLLVEKRVDREERIQLIKQTLENALAMASIQAKVLGRAKHLYSIFRKMTKKSIDFKEIHDLYAIRLIVPDLKTCYAALSVVHALWAYIPEEFDDYIAQPKPNGYRSIHTSVIGPYDRTLEVQIRTEEMNQEADLGIAAHWAYKENIKNVAQSLSEEENRVYVLSPKGEVFDLPVGSTPLDFAYRIHTQLGHQCKGAKVNNKMVTLKYKLRSGEQVQIIKTKKESPSRDWVNRHLGYLYTTRARSKVNAWFRAQEK